MKIEELEGVIDEEVLDQANDSFILREHHKLKKKLMYNDFEDVLHSNKINEYEEYLRDKQVERQKK